MHLPPEVWGPIFWATLHIVSLAYSDTPTYSEKKAAKEFYNSLVFLLPCPVCREHFKEVVQAAPVESWLDSRQSLIEWVWQTHNAVNTRLGKPAITMAEFLKRYNEMAERGLPIPPANPTSEISQELLQNEYIKGAFHGLMGLAVVGVVGGLLWASYGKN